MTGGLQVCFYHLQKSKEFICPVRTLLSIQDAELTAKTIKFFTRRIIQLGRVFWFFFFFNVSSCPDTTELFCIPKLCAFTHKKQVSIRVQHPCSHWEFLLIHFQRPSSTTWFRLLISYSLEREDQVNGVHDSKKHWSAAEGSKKQHRLNKKIVTLSCKSAWSCYPAVQLVTLLAQTAGHSKQQDRQSESKAVCNRSEKHFYASESQNRINTWVQHCCTKAQYNLKNAILLYTPTERTPTDLFGDFLIPV